MADGVTLEQIQVLVRANAQSFHTEMATVKSQIAGLKGMGKGVGAPISAGLNGVAGAAKTASAGIGALATGMKSMMAWLLPLAGAMGLGMLAKSSIEAGMAAVESENLFSVSMKGMASEARAWSEQLSSSFGLNAYELRKNVGMMNNMLTSMGLGTDSAYGMSKGLTQLAYDMSSLYNISSADAMDKLKSGITGESEPLKRLGILVTDNAVEQAALAHGMKTTAAQMTEQEKVYWRYVAIMDQTKNAQGDLARTLDSPANQMRMLKTSIDNLKISLGRAFEPILSIVLPILNAWAVGLRTIIDLMNEKVFAFFGMAYAQEDISTTADDAAKSQDALKKSTEAAAAAAKRSLSSFDQINKLQKAPAASTDTSGGSGGNTPTDNPYDMGTPEDVLSKVQEKIELIVGKIREGVGGAIQSVVDKFPALGFVIEGMVSGATAEIAMVQGVATTAGESVRKFVEQNKSTLMSSMAEIGFNANGTVLNLAAAYKGVMGGLSGFITDFWARNGSFLSDIGAKVLTAISNIWLPIQTFFSGIWLDLSTAINTFVNNPAFTRLKKVFLDFYDAVKPVFTWIWDKIVALTSKIGDGLTPVLGFLRGALSGVFTFLKDVALNIINGISNGLEGFTKLIKGDFKGAWDTMKSGMVDGLKFVGNTLTGIVNIVIRALNGMIEGFNKIGFKVPDWVPGIGGKGWYPSIPKIPEIPKLAQGGIIGANSPTLAVVGDNRTQPEVVAPLVTLMDMIGSKLSETLRAVGAGAAGNITIPVSIGDEQLANIIVNANMRRAIRANGR